MQTKQLTKNYFTTRQFDPRDKKIVFISYKHDPDQFIARKCDFQSMIW